MRRHFRHDCSHCQEYPAECDDCYNEVKASMHLKPRNKKRNTHKNNDIVYTN